MSLLDTIKLNLTPFHLEKINQIDNFDFCKTRKKVDHDFHGLTLRYLDEGIENLKRYYVVALLDPLNEHAISRYVDPFWHAHVLHTKEYSEFCNLIYGQYIHHQPIDFENPLEIKEVGNLYNYTREIYEVMFTQVDDSWWPKSEGTNLLSYCKHIVCRHMFVTNSVIEKSALFQKSKKLYSKAA